MLTELQVVNSMLSAAGLAPVNSEDSLHPNYLKASGTLNIISNQVQNLGLWFNTTYPTLALSTTGEIILPQNTLHCDPTDSTVNAAKRGNRLYNLDAQSYIHTAAVEVKLVLELDFDELPSSAQQYIRAVGRHEYYLDEDGTNPKLDRLDSARKEAWTQLYREHLRNRDTNYFDGPNVANNYARGRRPWRRVTPQE